MYTMNLIDSSMSWAVWGQGKDQYVWPTVKYKCVCHSGMILFSTKLVVRIGPFQLGVGWRCILVS